MLLEVLTNHVLGGIKTNVANEQGSGWLAGHIAKLGPTVLAALLGRCVVAAWLAWGAEVDADLAVVEIGAVLSLKGFGGVCCIDKLDVAEALAAATVAVGDDANARQLAKLLEFAGEPLLIHVPAEVADKQVAGSVLILSLSLDFLRCGLCVALRLALLALLGLWLLFLFLAGARVLIVVVGAVVVVLRSVSGSINVNIMQ